MRLIELNPGATKEQVIEEAGFELLVADTFEENAAPSHEELRLLRDEIDKDRYYIQPRRPTWRAAGDFPGGERRGCVVTRDRGAFARRNPPNPS